MKIMAYLIQYDVKPTHHQLLYVCDHSNRIHTYNLEGELVKSSFISACAIDLYQKRFYIVGDGKVSIFDLRFHLLYSFSTPHGTWDNLKVIRILFT